MGKNKGKKHKGNYNKNSSKSEQRKERQKEKRDELVNKKFNLEKNCGTKHVKKVKGDGNCLFRSISDQIEGSDENHKFYRKAACDYMKENEDHFKFFLTDDKSFDLYISEMSEDGIWGGNLELYAISMKFDVNIYIHIYNHAMYIIKNHAAPMKNLQLSYHDGEHYNSIRLKDDFEENSIRDISIDLIDQVEKTEIAENINVQDDFDQVQDDKKDELENRENGYTDNEDNEEKEIKNKKEIVKEVEVDKKEGEINFKDYLINDIKKLPEKKKNNFLLTQNGHFVRELNLNKKCHCNSGKKYKNCCKSTDIEGVYDSQTLQFYCDLKEFLNKFKNQLEGDEKNDEKKDAKKDEKPNKDSKNGNGSALNSLTNQFEKIYI